MKYHFKIHKEKKGYWAECIELEGLRSQGDSMEKLTKNLQEALDLFLSEPEDSKYIFPAPKRAIKDAIAIKVTPNVAFAMTIRNLRLRLGKTQTEMAEKLNFDSLYSYQRLESPKKANPTLSTLNAIKEAFPQFDLSIIL